MSNIYILRLHNETKEQIGKVTAENLEEAILFFMGRKQMDKESFNKIYEVIRYEK